MIVSPATSIDIAECCAVIGPMQWGMARAQLAHGSSWAMRNEFGVACVVAGIAPLLEPGAGEAWFIVNPHGWAQRHMLAVIRAVALTLPQSGYAAVRAVTETAAGARIAALCSFRQFEVNQGLEVWIWARP